MMCMKTGLVILLSTLVASHAVWLTDIDKAKAAATAKHRYILLNFSGSDWCVPCIRLEKNVFDKDEFISYADSSLVLLKADFPRSKKLGAEQVSHNETLAEKYNPSGKFPFTVLLDAKGNILKEWEDVPPGPAALISDINSIHHAGN